MLGQRIGQLRTAHGWNQVELAKRLGVAKQTISNWENGNIQPSIDMLIKICETFSVSSDYLLGLSEIKTLDVSGLSSEQILHIQNVVNDIKELNETST